MEVVFVLDILILTRLINPTKEIVKYNNKMKLSAETMQKKAIKRIVFINEMRIFVRLGVNIGKITVFQWVKT